MSQLSPRKPLPGKRKRLKRILAWGDAPMASTGFGKVMKYILAALYRTGKYEIDVVGVNHWGDPYDHKEYPYNIFPAGIPPTGAIGDSDVFGMERAGYHLYGGAYDYLFVLNDLYVMSGAVNMLEKINSRLPYKFKTVFYFPVDGPVPHDWLTMAEFAEEAVTYTQYGVNEMVKADPKFSELKVLNHGTDLEHFKKLPDAMTAQWKERSFGDPDVFVVGSVCRNSVRKDISSTIMAFSEFRKLVPNSVLYLHTQMVDNNIDLGPVIDFLGFKVDADVFLPKGYSTEMGFPIEALNRVYNLIDVFTLSTLGEGWGLPVTEAMAAQVPVVIPNNTSLTEMVTGIDGKDLRGWLVDSGKDIDHFVRADNSGLRPRVDIQQLADTWYEVYKLKTSGKAEDQALLQTRIDNAHNFVKNTTWEIICREWVKIFAHIDD